VAWIPNGPPNLIKIRYLTSSPFLICCAMGDLRTSHPGSYASDLMSYKYMINTVMSFFDQSDCSLYAKQIISAFTVSQSPSSLIGTYGHSHVICHQVSSYTWHIYRYIHCICKDFSVDLTFCLPSMLRASQKITLL
jgi:hypothetical protein